LEKTSNGTKSPSAAGPKRAHYPKQIKRSIPSKGEHHPLKVERWWFISAGERWEKVHRKDEHRFRGLGERNRQAQAGGNTNEKSRKKRHRGLRH